MLILVVLSPLSSRLSKPDFIFFSTVCRLLWFRRNSFIHDDTFLPPNLVYQHAIQAYDDYKEALMYHDHPSSHVTSACITWIAWIPHPDSMLKVNWDVTINRSCNRIGIGVIIRGPCGDVLASLQQSLSYYVKSLSNKMNSYGCFFFFYTIGSHVCRL